MPGKQFIELKKNEFAAEYPRVLANELRADELRELLGIGSRATYKRYKDDCIARGLIDEGNIPKTSKVSLDRAAEFKARLAKTRTCDSRQVLQTALRDLHRLISAFRCTAELRSDAYEYFTEMLSFLAKAINSGLAGKEYRDYYIKVSHEAIGYMEDIISEATVL